MKITMTKINKTQKVLFHIINNMNLMIINFKPPYVVNIHCLILIIIYFN